MATNEPELDTSDLGGAPNKGSGILAASGLLGALLASSCCILPLVLVTLGIGGAWMSSLTALEPFRPYFLAATTVLLGAGFWQVYVRRPRSCNDNIACAQPRTQRLTKCVLWVAVVLSILAATVNLWAPVLY